VGLRKVLDADLAKAQQVKKPARRLVKVAEAIGDNC
jgi:hypothetical protein